MSAGANDFPAGKPLALAFLFFQDFLTRQSVQGGGCAIRGSSMGRTKKYGTGQALRRAVEGYFASISRVKPVMEACNTGEKDQWGHFILEWRPVKNARGEDMTDIEFVIPPTVGGLCRYLGISRDTWSQYCSRERNPQFSETTEWAREQLLAWREKELMTRPGKDLTGVMFDLRMNYGMSERSGPVSSAQDDDPITRSLKEAANALKKTDTDPPLAL